MLNRAENHDGKHSTYAMVTVCDRWNPSKGGSFENFLADKGERPEGTTFGRFGDIGPYTDANTEWMTKRQQRTEASKKGTRLKLSEAKAKEIRQQYASGVLDQYDLADAFDVSQGQISHIINHKVWKDVGEVKDACLST
jgi:predicted XRE-type DNA-binding protein